jgi:hypothetical protein
MVIGGGSVVINVVVTAVVVVGPSPGPGKHENLIWSCSFFGFPSFFAVNVSLRWPVVVSLFLNATRMTARSPHAGSVAGTGGSGRPSFFGLTLTDVIALGWHPAIGCATHTCA